MTDGYGECGIWDAGGEGGSGLLFEAVKHGYK